MPVDHAANPSRRSGPDPRQVPPEVVDIHHVTLPVAQTEGADQVATLEEAVRLNGAVAPLAATAPRTSAVKVFISASIPLYRALDRRLASICGYPIAAESIRPPGWSG